MNTAAVNHTDMDMMEPLTGSTPWYRRSRRLMFNFVLMSCCFALNHGTVTALVALASTDEGKKLGGIGTGVLYAFYVLSALFIAPGYVQKIGSKWALVTGLTLYCFYVASFLVVSEQPSIKWYAGLTGSTLGGFAAGWLWTAQGSFFARTCQLYSQATGKDLSSATAWLAGLFASFYVGFEVLAKGASSLLHQWGGNSFVFTVFTIAAAISAFGMTWVRQPPEEDKEPRKTQQWYHKAAIAGELFFRSRKMMLLAPLNMAFGFTAAMMNYWVNGDPLKKAIGSDNVGYMNAVTPAVATLLSLPYSWITERIGKCSIMVFGSLNYVTMAVAIAALSLDQLEDLKWGLVFLYILGGSGRAVFEGTNKATFADFFPDDKEAAFANVIIWSGAASAFGFFLFPFMGKLAIAGITGGTGLFAVLCLVWAFRIHANETKVIETTDTLGQFVADKSTLGTIAKKDVEGQT